MTDPLADKLDPTRFRHEEDGSTSIFWADGAELARIAREHVAAEIRSRMAVVEDDGLDSAQLVWWWRGMDDAARIAEDTR